jgi:hypothetical protein
MYQQTFLKQKNIDLSADKYSVNIMDIQAFVGKNPNFIVDLQSEENGPDFSKLFDPVLTKKIAIRRFCVGSPKPALQSITIVRDKARTGRPELIVRVKVDKRQPRELVRAEVEVMGNIWRRRLGYGCPWTLQFTVR